MWKFTYMQMTASAEPKCKATFQVFQRTGSLWDSQMRINRYLPRVGTAGCIFQLHEGSVSSGDLLVTSLALFVVLSNVQLRSCIACDPFERGLRSFTFWSKNIMPPVPGCSLTCH